MALPKNSEAPPSGLPSWAVRGAKVVVVGYRGPGARSGAHPLKMGDIYTIRDVLYGPESGLPCIRLVEIRRSPVRTSLGVYEPMYRLRGFRPLHTIETDISEHFAELLNVPNQVDA